MSLPLFLFFAACGESVNNYVPSGGDGEPGPDDGTLDLSTFTGKGGSTITDASASSVTIQFSTTYGYSKAVWPFPADFDEEDYSKLTIQYEVLTGSAGSPTVSFKSWKDDSNSNDVKQEGGSSTWYASLDTSGELVFNNNAYTSLFSQSGYIGFAIQNCTGSGTGALNLKITSVKFE